MRKHQGDFLPTCSGEMITALETSTLETATQDPKKGCSTWALDKCTIWAPKRLLPPHSGPPLTSRHVLHLWCLWCWRLPGRRQKVTRGCLASFWGLAISLWPFEVIVIYRCLGFAILLPRKQKEPSSQITEDAILDERV